MSGVIVDLRKYEGFVDFDEAMSALAGEMAEPWDWNKWQKAASEMLLVHPDGKRSQSDWSKLRVAHMEQRFGLQWKDLAKRAKRGRRHTDKHKDNRLSEQINT